MAKSRIGNLEVAALAAPTFMYAGFEFGQKALMPAFLAQYVGLSLGAIGAMLFALRLFDIFAAGLVGALSDAFGEKWGRRRVWMAAGAPVALVSTWLAFTIAPGASFGLVACTLLLMLTGWTLMNAPHGAWALEASSGIDGRSRVFMGRMVAGILGSMGFSWLAVQAGPSMPDQLRQIAFCLMIGVPISTIALFFAVEDVTPGTRRIDVGALLAPFGFAFSTRRTIRLAGLFALSGAHAAIAVASFVFMVRYGFALPGATAQALFANAAACALGLPCCLLLSRRVGPYNVMAITFTVRFFLCAALLAIPAGSMNALLLWSIAAGFFTGSDFMLLRALVGEELDRDATQSGSSRAGTFYAAFHFPYNLAAAFATGALFAIYRLAGFDLNSPHNMMHEIVVGAPAIAGMLLALSSLALLASDKRERQERYPYEKEQSS